MIDSTEQRVRGRGMNSFDWRCGFVRALLWKRKTRFRFQWKARYLSTNSGSV